MGLKPEDIIADITGGLKLSVYNSEPILGLK
jgi:hypothetical protein